MNDSVVIIGLANAGKSTLFNALCGKKQAIVSKVAGTTRDWNQAPATLGSLRFTIIDTLGISERKFDPRLVELVEQAKAVIFLVDGTMPTSPEAEALLRLWRKKVTTPFVAVANKCEGKKGSATDCWQLGLGEPVEISSSHKTGFGELHTALKKFINPSTREAAATESAGRQGLRLVLLGSPNVGKSSLANRLIAKNRMATDVNAGTTTDSVLIPFESNGEKFELVDTAGITKRRVKKNPIASLSVGQSLRALRLAEVALVVFEPLRSPTNDVKIMEMARKEGRAMVAVLNKCDTLASPKHQLKQLAKRLEKARFFNYQPVGCSAKSGIGCDEILTQAIAAAKLWRKRITTSPLNRWLATAVEAHPLPLYKGRRLKVKFISQIKTAPPTFLLSVSNKFPNSYVNYLESHLRRSFEFGATPIRFIVKETAK